MKKAKPLVLLPLRLEISYKNKKAKIRWYPDDLQSFPHVDKKIKKDKSQNEQLEHFFSHGFDLKFFPKNITLYSMDSLGRIHLLCTANNTYMDSHEIDRSLNIIMRITDKVRKNDDNIYVKILTKQEYGKIIKKAGSPKLAWLFKDIYTEQQNLLKSPKRPPQNVLKSKNFIRPLSFLGPVKLASPDILAGKWLEDFENALACGMAVEITGPDQYNKLLKAEWLLVSGYNEASNNLLDDLIDKYNSVSKMKVLTQDEPTNNTEEVKVSPVNKESSSDHNSNSQNHIKPGKNDQLFTNWLGLSKSMIASIPNADRIEHDIVGVMNRLLWPVCSQNSHTMKNGEQQKVKNLFENYVSGRGLLPGLRIQNNPYGFVFTAPRPDVEYAPLYGKLEEKLKHSRPNINLAKIFLTIAKTHGRTLHRTAVKDGPVLFPGNARDWDLLNQLTSYSPVWQSKKISSFDRLLDILRQNSVSKRIDLLVKDDDSKDDHQYLNEVLLTNYNDPQDAKKEIKKYLLEVKEYLKRFHISPYEDWNLIPDFSRWLKLLIDGDIYKFDAFLTDEKQIKDDLFVLQNNNPYQMIKESVDANLTSALFAQLNKSALKNQKKVSLVQSHVKSVKGKVTFIKQSVDKVLLTINEINNKIVLFLKNTANFTQRLTDPSYKADFFHFNSFKTNAVEAGISQLEHRINNIQRFLNEYEEIKVSSKLKNDIENSINTENLNGLGSNLTDIMEFKNNAVSYFFDIKSKIDKIKVTYQKIPIDGLKKHLSTYHDKINDFQNRLYMDINDRLAASALNKEEKYQKRIDQFTALKNNIKGYTETFNTNAAGISDILILTKKIEEYSNHINASHNPTGVNILLIKDRTIKNLKDILLKDIYTLKNELKQFNDKVSVYYKKLIDSTPNILLKKMLKESRDNYVFSLEKIKGPARPSGRPPFDPGSPFDPVDIINQQLKKQLKNMEKSVFEKYSNSEKKLKDRIKVQNNKLQRHITNTTIAFNAFNKKVTEAMNNQIDTNQDLLKKNFSDLITGISHLIQPGLKIENAIQSKVRLLKKDNLSIEENSLSLALTARPNSQPVIGKINSFKSWSKEKGDLTANVREFLEYQLVWKYSTHLFRVPLFMRLLLLSAKEVIDAGNQNENKKIQNTLQELYDVLENELLSIDNLKSLLMETIDCFSHRLDAWITANAAEQLDRWHESIFPHVIMANTESENRKLFQSTHVDGVSFLTMIYNFILDPENKMRASLGRNKINFLRNLKMLNELKNKFILKTNYYNPKERFRFRGFLTTEEKLFFHNLLYQIMIGPEIEWFEKLKEIFLYYFGQPDKSGLNNIIKIFSLFIDNLYESKVFHAGVYGWLENPINQIQKSNQYEYHQAPSLDQAKTTAILRAASVDNQTKFDVNLSAGRVQKAAWFFQGLQKGFSPAELLGYQAERTLHDLGADYAIHELREFEELTVTSHTGHPVYTKSIVLDGDKLADLFSFASSADDKEMLQYLDFKTYCNKDNKLRQYWPDIVKTGQTVLNIRDAASDIGIAETVYQHLRGNHSRVTAWMEAVEGKNIPPQPEVIKTPRTGQSQLQRIIYLSDYHSIKQNEINDLNPSELAEPSMASFCRKILDNGEGTKFEITVKYRDKKDDPFSMIMDYKSDLAMTPFDLVIGSKEVLERRVKLYLWKYIRTHKKHKGLHEDQIPFLLYTKIENKNILTLQNGQYYFNDDITSKDKLLGKIGQNILSEDELSLINQLWDLWLEFINPVHFFNHASLQFSYDQDHPDNQINKFRQTLVKAKQLKALLNQVEPLEKNEFSLNIKEDSQHNIENSILEKEKVCLDYIARLKNLSIKLSGILNRYNQDEIVFDHIQDFYDLNYKLSLFGPPLAQDPVDLSQLLKKDEVLQKSKIEHILSVFFQFKNDMDSFLSDLQKKGNNPDKKLKFELKSGNEVFKVAIQLKNDHLIFFPDIFAIPDHLQEHFSGNMIKKIALERLSSAIKILIQSLCGDSTVIFPPCFLNDLKVGLNDGENKLHALIYVRKRLKAFDDLIAIKSIPYKNRIGYYKEWEQAVTEAAVEAGLDINNIEQFNITPSRDEWQPSNIDFHILAHNNRMFDKIINNQPAKIICGFKIDEWTDFIPNNNENTAITFNYDAPEAEAPNAILISAPPKSGQWDKNNLPQTIANVIDLLRIRTVTMDDILKTPLNRYFPIFSYDHKLTEEFLSDYREERVEQFKKSPLTNIIQTELNSDIAFKKKR